MKVYKVSLITGDGDGLARFHFKDVFYNEEDAIEAGNKLIQEYLNKRVRVAKEAIDKGSERYRDVYGVKPEYHLDPYVRENSDHIIIGKEKEITFCGYGKTFGALVEEIKIKGEKK